jgi:hypothetical protein
MAQPRHYEDQIVLSLYRRESSYDVPVALWTTKEVAAMRDFSGESGHELWDDLVTDDNEMIHNTEYPLVQEIVRQSVRIPYSEPRVKPETLAGLMGLALGSIESTRDGVATAYRHAVLPIDPTTLPSVSAQIAHMHSSQFLYSGIKADGFTVSKNEAYLAFASTLIGSGSRSTSATSLPANPLVEPWLRWGDCHIYLRDVTVDPLVSVPGIPLVVPVPILQGQTNLGEGAIDVSTRVLRLELNYPNHLWAEGGYRASTGMVRGNLVTAKRSTDLILELQVETADEARDLAWYLQQRSIAFELQCVSTLLVDPAGTFFFGVTMILPRVQFRAIVRHEQFQFDTLELQGQVMDDQTNPVILGWVYNARPFYLLDCVQVPETLRPDLEICLDLEEATGTRVDDVGSTDMTPLNGVTRVPSAYGFAAHFDAASFQSLTATANGDTTLTGPFGLVFKVTPGTFPGTTQALLSQGSSASAGQYEWWVLLKTDGHLTIAFGGGFAGVIASSTAILTPDVEAFIMIWHDGDTVFLQVNNGVIDSAAGASFTVEGAMPFCIGAIGHTSAADHTAARLFFHGAIDSVQKYGVALEDQEDRTQLWNNGKGVRCVCP